MKMEIKAFSKGTIALCLLWFAFWIFLILCSIYYQEYAYMFMCIIILLLSVGYFIYTYATTASFLIEEKGIHILRGRKEKNFLPWNLVQIIGYQRAHVGRYLFDFLYVSLADRKRTEQLIHTAKTYGLSGDTILSLNGDVLKNPLDFTKTDKKLLILSEQTSMKEFDQLRRIQIIYAKKNGGKIAETCVNLDPGPRCP